MEPFLVIGLLACALALFASEKVSVDLVTLGLLATLVLTGVLSGEEAFAGYGREVIVMLGSIFVVGAALRETGVLDTLGHLLARASGGSIGRLKTEMMEAWRGGAELDAMRRIKAALDPDCVMNPGKVLP